MKRWYVAAAVSLVGLGSASFAKDAEIILLLAEGKFLIDAGPGPALVAGGIAAAAIGSMFLLTDDDSGSGSGVTVSRL